MSNSSGISVVKTFNGFFEQAVSKGQVIVGFDLFSEILMEAVAGDDAFVQQGIFNKQWANKEAAALKPYLDKFDAA